MPKTILLNNISEIASKYDAFIIDIWGVLHDGMRPYINARPALKFLADSDKKVILLSNAPRSSEITARRLEELGFKKNLYHSLVTSGDLLHGFFTEIKRGNSYFHIGKESDSGIIQDLGYKRTEDYHQADFIVCTGYSNLDQLENIAETDLIMYCANPDLEIVRQDGGREYCAGFVAKKYIEMGGRVEYFGKPGAFGYHRCMKLLNDVEKSKILCVGDSFYTDIKGAHDFGLDSLFIAGGLHGVVAKDSDEMIKKLSEDYACFPTYIVQTFLK